MSANGMTAQNKDPKFHIDQCPLHQIRVREGTEQTGGASLPQNKESKMEVCFIILATPRRLTPLQSSFNHREVPDSSRRSIRHACCENGRPRQPW